MDAVVRGAVEALRGFYAASGPEKLKDAPLALSLHNLLTDLAKQDTEVRTVLERDFAEPVLAHLKVLDKPLTREEIKAQAKLNNDCISGILAVSVGEIAQGGESGEAWLDSLSERLTGTLFLMDISWEVRGHLDGNTLLLEVSGDASEVLDQLDEDDGDDEAEADDEGSASETETAAAEEVPAAPREPLSTFLVRTNCEYSLEVEAASEEDAIKEAEKVDYEEWSQSWAPWEVE